MSDPTIAHVVSSLLIGGAEKFVVNLATQQRTNGADVRVYSFGSADDPLCQPLTLSGVEVYCLPDLGLSRWGISKLIATAEVVHIHSPAVVRALAPAFLPLLKPKVVYTIHGEVDPDLSLLKLTHQLARLYLDAITAVSASARESVSSRYSWDKEMVSVINNGVPLPKAPLPFNETPVLRLGTVSRLVSLKNIPMLFHAIASLPLEVQRKLKVVVVGDGPSRVEVENEASALPETECEFTGSLNSDLDIFDRIDVLVNCSDTEGLPISIIEALGFGRAVIATAVGAVPSVISHGETGWLYQPRDTEALAKLIALVVERPDLAHRAALAGRESALKNYSIESVAANFKTVYEASSDLNGR